MTSLDYPLRLAEAVGVLSLATDLAMGQPDAPSIWADALRAEPGPQPMVGADRLDACLSAIADSPT